MLIQLHQQYVDGHTDFIAQREINDGSSDEMHRFVDETVKAHPLPMGTLWLVVNEKSELFMHMSADKKTPGDSGAA